MPSAWRLTKTKFANTPLSGDGARIYGGRWNSPGLAVVYFAESVSLAVLEILVHIEASSLLESYSLVHIDFDGSLVRELPVAELPSNWRDYPAPPEAQAIGDSWIRSLDSAILRVPSTIVPCEQLILLNPSHARIAEILVSENLPFSLDSRLNRTPAADK